MSAIQSQDSALLSFIAAVKADFEKSLRILTETNTLSITDCP